MRFLSDCLAFLKKIPSLEKKQKIAIALISAFVILDLSVFCVLICVGKYSSAEIAFDNSTFEREKLVAVNRQASSKFIKKGYAFYRFTPEQSERLSAYYEHFGSVGINVRVGLKNACGRKFDSVMESEKLFTFGFISQDEFDRKDRFVRADHRVLSGCDLRNFIKRGKGFSYFSNELSIEKNLDSKKLPAGIEIYSEYPVQVFDFFVTQARIGYDFTGEIPFYGVSSNGGSFGGTSRGFDFSGSSLVFPVENSNYSIMPKVELAFYESEDYGTPADQLKVELNAGGEKIKIRRTKSVEECVIQASLMNAPFSTYDFSENSGLIKKLIMSANDKSLIPEEPGVVLEPLKTDPGLILDGRQSAWRTMDYELYEWDRFPGVLFFDTADYEVQSDFFRRLSFFVEKAGFRGRLLTDEQLGDMHGYNAHDYGAEGLASFFSKAKAEGFPLNKKELILRDILLRKGVIVPDANTYRAGSGALISISRESAQYNRLTFLAHEAWHGIFFIDEDFRNAVAAVYYTVDDKTMSFIKGYWASQPGLGYDPADDFLMKNEFMAYIMQQPLSNVSAYFIHLANRGSVMNAMPDLCAWVRNTSAVTFEDAGRILDTYAFDNWGLRAGRVMLMSR